MIPDFTNTLYNIHFKVNLFNFLLWAPKQSWVDNLLWAFSSFQLIWLFLLKYFYKPFFKHILSLSLSM